MNEDLIREHIAKELSKRIAEGVYEFNSVEFASFHGRMINPNTMERYILREPLFKMDGTYKGYPSYLFIPAPRSMLSLRPAKDWTTVLAACLTAQVLNEWILKYTKETKTGAGDPVIRQHQVTNFQSALSTLKFKRLSKEISTKKKIKIVEEEIKTFWSIAYGHKK